MRIRATLAVAALLLATQTISAAGQATRDRARLVFTISGAYIDGKGLWSVPDQPLVTDGLEDNLSLGREVKSTVAAALAGTYFPGDHVGLTAEAFLMGLGYNDSCRLNSTGGSARIAQVCADIDQQEKSAAAVAMSVGGIVRVGSREFISPFARASVGLLLMNQSSVLTQGVNSTNALLTIYEDESRTRIRPAIGLGLGATMMLSRGYHLRWEVRDNIVGIERVTGPVEQVTQIPPHETAYKHLFSLFIGLDVILERQRGRRY
jgi:opacity protein-like surface antigen